MHSVLHCVVSPDMVAVAAYLGAGEEWPRWCLVAAVGSVLLYQVLVPSVDFL